MKMWYLTKGLADKNGPCCSKKELKCVIATIGIIIQSIAFICPWTYGLSGHCLWQAYLAATEQFNSQIAILGTSAYRPTDW
jgi:hypothetical protein